MMLAAAKTPFQLFGTDHLIVLGLTVFLAIGLIFLVRWKGEDDLLVKRSLQVLAGLLLLSFPFKFAAFYTAKEPMLDHALPMHLCNWAAIVGGLAILTKRQLLCELLYFWGLAATLQAVITPNVPYAFPHPIFITFFITHSGVVIAALVVAFGLRRTPRLSGFWKAFLWAQVYLVAAALANVVTGANYGFLRSKPTMGSLMDHLGPWPYYILGLEVIALLSFSLLNLPFLRSQIRNR